MAASNNRKSALLTSGTPAWVLTRLSAPMAIGILAMMGFNALDTFFVGRLGVAPLTAMALTFPIAMVVTSVSLGLGISTSIAVSKSIGEGDDRGARLATDGLVLGLVVSVLFAMAASVWIERLVVLLGGHDETLSLAIEYLRIWEVGIPLVMLSIVSNMAIRATGDTLTPGVLMIASISLNAVLDPVFIFGYWGCPAMGIKGAAWATVLSRLLSVSVAMSVLRWREHMLTSPFAPWHILRKSYMQLAGSAVPIALNNMITPVTMGVYTRIVAGISDEAVAGMGVALRVQSLGTTPIYALQSVVGIFVGQNSGAGAIDRVRRGVRSAMRFGLLWGATMFLVLLVIGQRLASYFNPDQQVIQAAMFYFAIVGVSFALRGMYLVGSASLNALGHPAMATTITAVSGVAISIPLAWLGAWITADLWGTFCGIAAGGCISGIAAWVALKRKMPAAISGEYAGD